EIAEAPFAARALDVLVVDDNEINALLSRAALAHMGHAVALAADGAAAVEAVAAARADGHPFDAVLMDLHMPGLDGFSTIRALREAEAEDGDRRLMVIALTADGTPAAAERARASGADATMVKPIDRNRLAALLARLARAPAAADHALTA
ncbi:MAG: response regulator, partial [Siculibacillus sp.]